MTKGFESIAPMMTGLGEFPDFSDAWLACLDATLGLGHVRKHDDDNLLELLNVSLFAASCDSSSLESAGADPARIARMLTKYDSHDILPEYDISYGDLFWDHQGVDQISWLTDRLRAKENTNSATIGFHVPGTGTLSCISLVDAKLRDGRAYLTGVYRSQNVFRSQPGNALALWRLLEHIAGGVEAEPGGLTLHIMSAHILGRDEQLARSTVDNYRQRKPPERMDL